MSFGQAVSNCFTNYANFSGRARRSEYWYFTLFHFLINFAVGLLRIPAVSSLVALALFIPSLAVGVRRLHDIGKSGWYILIALVPLVGAILLLVWECRDSDPGSNLYGPNPKGYGEKENFSDGF